jgi:hypothetical protein
MPLDLKIDDTNVVADHVDTALVFARQADRFKQQGNSSREYKEAIGKFKYYYKKAYQEAVIQELQRKNNDAFRWYKKLKYIDLRDDEIKNIFDTHGLVSADIELYKNMLAQEKD